MEKSSASIFRQKKLLFPLLSVAIVMSINLLIFILPQPLATQLHETTVGQYQSIKLTPEINVELDKARAEAYGINIRQLGNLLRSDNFTLASGTVVDGGKKYGQALHVMSRLSFQTPVVRL